MLKLVIALALFGLCFSAEEEDARYVVGGYRGYYGGHHGGYHHGGYRGGYGGHRYRAAEEEDQEARGGLGGNGRGSGWGKRDAEKDEKYIAYGGYRHYPYYSGWYNRVGLMGKRAEAERDQKLLLVHRPLMYTYPFMRTHFIYGRDAEGDQEARGGWGGGHGGGGRGWGGNGGGARGWGKRDAEKDEKFLYTNRFYNPYIYRSPLWY